LFFLKSSEVEKDLLSTVVFRLVPQVSRH
jgi:hypothetical protein